MNIKLLKRLFILLASVPLVSQASNKAEAFLKGEPACFDVHQVEGDPSKFTLKLVATPINSGVGAPISQVNGLLHGTLPKDKNGAFFAELVGTATIAPPNGSSEGVPVLQIGLYESDYSVGDKNLTTGIWVGHYGIVLKPEDLSGTMVGQYNYTPIKKSDDDPGPSVRKVLSETLLPMSCSAF